MGVNFNPGNEAFAKILKDRYVDKTGLITQFDSTLYGSRSLVLSSRPRRFGKSYAARAIVAFYSAGCDSRKLFEGLSVSEHDGWDRNLNQLNVVRLDMTAVMKAAGGARGVEAEATRSLLAEMREEVPFAGTTHAGRGDELQAAVLDVVHETGRQFLFVIDEWDAPYRLAAADVESQDAYASWLRSLFKNEDFTAQALAGAYLTGILPIKKYAHQSAVSDFREYMMTRPGVYAPYVGFTSDEVAELCDEYGLDQAEMRDFYDGYRLRYRRDVFEVYAPYSVIEACDSGEVDSFWTSSEAYESLLPYIEADLDGLQEKVLSAVGGMDVPMDPSGFTNDMVTLDSADDALTLLVHLGYLAWDAERRVARVPNREVRAELVRTLKRSRHPKLRQAMLDSIDLVTRLLKMDEAAVAAGIAAVHDRECTPLFYNNEQALRAVVKTALIASMDDYARIEELPGGKGFADIVYLPGHASSLPILVVELKWNRHDDAAIAQIRERRYPDALEGLDVPMLLVGITYDARTKEHACRIEEWKL